MKFNKLYTAVLFLVTALFIGCSEYEDTVVPGEATPDGCQGVYFPTTNTSVFELEPSDETTISLTVARTETGGSVDVPVTVEVNTQNVFDVPASVTFADGESEKSFDVTFPSAAEGVTYSLKLTVSGADFVNPYGSQLPYVAVNVTRIKWETISEPMVYVDGTFSALYGVDIVPMYVEAQKAQLGESVRYRFKNVYRPASGAWDGDDWVAADPDADGIYDGYPSVWPGEMDESKDWYTTIEIDNPSGVSGDVFMYAHEIGVAWSYGMMSIGSVYGNLSQNIGTYPLGTLEDGVITFPANSLYFSMANYKSGAKYPSSTPTIIYLTKEAYIKANMKISDFNEVEYGPIIGEVNEFYSNAYSDGWTQGFSAAIDIDAENPDSEYKNLFYLPDLYAYGYGLAFYYDEGRGFVIPDNQPIGTTFMQKDIYVSASKEIESSITVNAKGVTVYTLGLTFHYADGTVLGDFAEMFYYSENPVVYTKDDFLGDFVLTGTSMFVGGADANMNVNITSGTEANTFVITGIEYAEEVIANYDATTNVMSISPQALADYGSYDMTFYTYGSTGVSTDPLEFVFNIQGNLVLSNTSIPFAYLIRSEAAGGWVDGYRNLMFAPSGIISESASTKSVSSVSIRQIGDINNEEVITSNFKIHGKMNPKSLKKTISNPVGF